MWVRIPPGTPINNTKHNTMEFTVNSTDLRGMCAELVKTLSPKSVVRILDYFLVSVTESGLSMLAGTQELSLRMTSELVSWNSDIQFCVSGKELASMVKTIPSGIPVKMEVTPTTLHINYGSGKFSLAVIDAANYPESKKVETKWSFDIPAEKLNLAEYVQFAAGTDTSRPVMCGTLMANDNGRLMFAATDTHKLTVVDMELPGLPEGLKAIIPTAAMNRLQLFAKDAGEIRIEGKETRIEISASDGSLSMNTALIQGNFPNVRRVIPKNDGHVLRCKVKDLLDALSRIAVCAPGHSQMCILDVNVLSARFESKDIDFSRTAETELAAEYDGPAIKMGLNHIFLAEIAKHIPTPDMEIMICDASRPMRITPASDTDLDYNLVMVQVPITIME